MTDSQLQAQDEGQWQQQQELDELEQLMFYKEHIEQSQDNHGGHMTFTELSKVNVNEHVEKKQNLSYLSWAWAVDYMTRLDEDSEWEFREWEGRPFLTLPDQTCMVYCTVTFGGRKRTAHLPIMDHRNKAIQNPDAFQINTAMQRALVKAIALHGLGLYIYAGEDLPKDEADAKEDKTKLPTAPITPTTGSKDGLTKEEISQVDGVVSAMQDWLTDGSIADAVLTLENSGLSNEQRVYLWTFFDSKERSAMKKEHEAQKGKLKKD